MMEGDRKKKGLESTDKDAWNREMYIVRVFDLGQSKEALRHWEQALRRGSNNADALAGKAIGLELAGNRPGALAAYRSAVRQDKRYLECNVLQIEFSWSVRACETARPLIEALSREERQGSQPARLN
jgi:tetratricopeptide (TPR) repeat protein